MNINWFPGHMFKSQKEIKSMINLVDIVIEIRDSRSVISTTNPDIENLTKGKPKLIILSKSDLADKKITQEWINFYEKDGINCIDLNILNSQSLKKVREKINFIIKEKLERYRLKGVKNYIIRGIVLGIPNVGKSSLINKISNNSSLKVENRPGVTKSLRWIRTKWNLDLLDTPGILWPKFDNEQIGLNLAYIGSIKDEILDIEELTYKLLEFLILNYKSQMENLYDLEIGEDVSECLEIIGKKLGCFKKESLVDYLRLSKIILKDFRTGKIGNISFETPENLINGVKNEI